MGLIEWEIIVRYDEEGGCEEEHSMVSARETQSLDLECVGVL